MSKYVERVIEDVKTKYANEPEFCQTGSFNFFRPGCRCTSGI